MVTAEYVSEEQRIGQVNTMRNGLLGTITGTIKDLYYVTLENGSVKALTYDSFLRGYLDIPISEIVCNKNFHFCNSLKHERVKCLNGELVNVSSHGYCSYDIEYSDGNVLVGVSELFLNTYLRASEQTFKHRSDRVRDYINTHKGWNSTHDGSKYKLTGNFKNSRKIEIEFEDGTTVYEDVIHRKKIEHPYLKGRSKVGIKVESMLFEDGEYCCVCNEGSKSAVYSLNDVKRMIEYGYQV